MPTMTDVRRQYPQYNDMSDQQLADALHDKFYADMPKDQFYQKVGLKQSSAPRPAAPAQQPSILGQLWSGTKNVAAGFAQGRTAIPDLVTEGIGKAVSLIPTTLGEVADAAGFPNAAQYLHNTASHMAHPTTLGSLVDQASPTPNAPGASTVRFIASMAGGGGRLNNAVMNTAVNRAAGTVPKATSQIAAAAARANRATPDVVDQAKQVGVRVLTSDAKPPQTFIGKAVQAMPEKIPFIGTGGVRAAQQTERVNAVKNIAQEYGAATSDELTAPAIDAVASDLAARRGAELTRLTGLKTSVINNTPGVVPTTMATRAINQAVSELGNIGTDASNAVISKLRNWQQALQGKDLATIEMIRKEMGEAFKDPNLASIRSTGEKALSAIYGPLREDMGNFIKAQGGQGAFAKWQTANNALSSMAGELGNATLRSVLNKAESTPEDVARMLFSQKPSDVARLYAGLSPMGRSKAQAAILQRAVEKAGGMENISPDRFTTQITNLGKSAGVFFTGADAARLGGLNRVLKATRRASEASLAPPTGVHTIPYLMGAGLTHAFGLVGGIAAGGGISALAHIYESAPVRDLLLRIGKSQPGSANEQQLMNRLSGVLAATFSNQTRSPASVGALNDNLAAITSSAASPAGGDPYGNQQ